MSSEGTERRPTAVFTTMGKNAIKKATITFGARPKPNQTNNKGAKATCGTSCDATSNGYVACSKGRQVAIATASITPTAAAIAKPSSTSSIVTRDWSAR